MSDVAQAVEAPLANAPSARTADGTIVDQATVPKPDTQTQTTQTTDTAKAATSTEAAKAPPADKSLAAQKDEKPAGAPAKYEPFKAPEGYEIDEKLSTEASATFKELGLSQDQAQKLMDVYFKTTAEAEQAPYKLYEETRGKWRDEVVKNPTLGDGTNLLPAVKATIGRAIDSLPADLARDFRAAMDLTGAGDNPAFIKAFHALAQRVTEGTTVRGGNPSEFGQQRPGAAPKSAAAALYPNLPSAS